jgi:hypothetical protein
MSKRKRGRPSTSRKSNYVASAVKAFVELARTFHFRNPRLVSQSPSDGSHGARRQPDAASRQSKQRASGPD